MDDYCYFVTRSSQKQTPRTMHLVHASWILLRGGCTSANFCNDARSTPTRRARELHARSIVRHYVRVPFAVRAINESRLCFLTMNVSVVSESSGRPTRSMTGGGGEKGGDSADSKVGIIAIITAPLKQETARTISRWFCDRVRLLRARCSER